MASLKNIIQSAPMMRGALPIKANTGGKITPVPNGPLIKKKGPFKGSTLKSGDTVKKAQEGATMSPYMQKRAAQQLIKEKNIRARDSILNRNANAKGMTRAEVQAQQERDKNKPDVQQEGLQIGKACKRGDTKGSCSTGQSNKGESLKDTKRNGGPIKKAKAGAMIKRADGSFSKRGLWDNIRANKGSGKKPTKQMLVQEKKIKAKSKK